MKRTRDCRYDDISKRSQTYILQDKLNTLQIKLRELESQSKLLPSPMDHPQDLPPSFFLDHTDDLIDVSSSHSSDQLSEPTVYLSPEMHNTLYVTPIQNCTCFNSLLQKVFKPLLGIVDNAVFTQTLIDSIRYHPPQSFNAPRLALLS